MSSTSGSSNSSPSSGGLPPASYDGSHLPWCTFRQEVLAPHKIHILDSPPKDRIPTAFLQIVEAASQDTSHFDIQKNCFWNQVTTGRGFGPSPIFPPNLLPPLANESHSRCMVPFFGSREALPERTINHPAPFYELSVPRPGLGCGFSAAAFTNKELAIMPQWLQATGTIVHFETGYIAPGASLYCPFLTFERAYGNKKQRVESANNQCAIAGAYCTRALQMLYTRARKDPNDGSMTAPNELPVSFSCTIDNSFALLNLHWIDLEQGQAYCMAPLCQFDLSKDVHFSKFLVWTQAIGDWGLSHVLPLIKEALGRLQEASNGTPTALCQPHYNTASTRLRLDTGPAIMKDELLISSLKTTFENIPWRFEDEGFSGVSSSTASWGSPMMSDYTFAKVNYPTVQPPRSNISAPNSSIVARKRVGGLDLSRSPVTPPPAYLQNPDLLWQKRFNHAMEEIRQLQNQMQAFKREIEDCKRPLLEEKARPNPTTSPSVESRPSNEDTRETTDLESTTPKVQSPPLSLASTKPSPSDTILSLAGSATWKCAAIVLSGHFLASFVPNTTIRLITYGCITNACLLACLTPKFTLVGMSTSATKFPTFAIWKWR
ncbi:uncharacterized protein Z519_06526 [Cladophialophora bantiana CBS 173.52]|uniref:DUF7924 domain-containing protein n=1 Tax=Cladophialophora bantiana (strain ATCC 10958 / CBS 173.52 / CDC B-1940 / NIH 8579) TaxID=1442370 RepID=A0A0D2I759_CLAB1|nr:uncharacterized protein Z519_06526 [Cladophialophora bantiana CBS 173.52]KIW92679.1 hypothetical protein Z519_06526 [Cladophialophora bantiana CBS 173.52]